MSNLETTRGLVITTVIVMAFVAWLLSMPAYAGFAVNEFQFDRMSGECRVAYKVRGLTLRTSPVEPTWISEYALPQPSKDWVIYHSDEGPGGGRT
jgi:hypothetical protein